MGGFGLGSGMLWKSAEADAQSKGLPTEPHSWLDLLRRFWAVIAILVFFVSFARSVTPYLALTAAFATFFLAREIGRRLNAAMRNPAVLLLLRVPLGLCLGAFWLGL